MSDFESRVREALDAGADGAPDAIGLADDARRRARARRRTTVLVAAAAVLAVVAVPVGVAAMRDSGGSGSGVVSDPTDSPTSTVPDGWRTETWRDLEVQVPDDWGYGALTTWCIGSDKPGAPVVQRPEGVVAMIACTPSQGYGVSFFDSTTLDSQGDPGPVQVHGGGSYPEGAWVANVYIAGGSAVTIVAADEQTAQQVLDSATKVEGVDSNGCAPKEGATASQGDATDDRLSVCRYDAGGWLVQGERLSAEDSAAAMAALAAAPMRQEQEPCVSTPDRYGSVVMGTGEALGSVRIVWESACAGGRGIFFSGLVRELTPDVMYWALSPGWSGGVDGDVPLPPELRR